MDAEDDGADGELASGPTLNAQELRGLRQIRKLHLDQITDLRVIVVIDRLGVEVAKNVRPAENFTGRAALFDVLLLEGDSRRERFARVLAW